MTAFPPGLYETLVTEALADRLKSLPRDRRKWTDGLRNAEAADRISWHIASPSWGLRRLRSSWAARARGLTNTPSFAILVYGGAPWDAPTSTSTTS